MKVKATVVTDDEHAVIEQPFLLTIITARDREALQWNPIRFFSAI